LQKKIISNKKHKEISGNIKLDEKPQLIKQCLPHILCLVYISKRSVWRGLFLKRYLVYKLHYVGKVFYVMFTLGDL